MGAFTSHPVLPILSAHLLIGKPKTAPSSAAPASKAPASKRAVASPARITVPVPKMVATPVKSPDCKKARVELVNPHVRTSRVVDYVEEIASNSKSPVDQMMNLTEADMDRELPEPRNLEGSFGVATSDDDGAGHDDGFLPPIEVPRLRGIFVYLLCHFVMWFFNSWLKGTCWMSGCPSMQWQGTRIGQWAAGWEFERFLGTDLICGTYTCNLSTQSFPWFPLLVGWYANSFQRYFNILILIDFLGV